MASSNVWFWSLPLTVDLVSPNLGVRQAFIVLGDGADGLALAQAGSLQFEAVRAMHDAVEDRISDGGIAEHFGMPQRLTGELLRCGWLTRTIPSTASAFRSVTDARDGDRG